MKIVPANKTHHEYIYIYIHALKCTCMYTVFNRRRLRLIDEKYTLLKYKIYSNFQYYIDGTNRKTSSTGTFFYLCGIFGEFKSGLFRQ